MGIDTKGCVATPCKDAFFVIEMVEKTLNTLIQPHLPKFPWQKAQAKADSEAAQPAYSRVAVEFQARERMARFNFSYAGEHRTLWLFFDCDCDNRICAPQSLSMSMGCWGHSDLFIKTALTALSPLGEVYFDYNDCDEEDMARLEVAPLTYVTAYQQGLVSASRFDLTHWKNLYEQGLLRKGTFEEVIGMPKQTVEDILTASYEQGKAMLTAICANKNQAIQAAE